MMSLQKKENSKPPFQYKEAGHKCNNTKDSTDDGEQPTIPSIEPPPPKLLSPLLDKVKYDQSNEDSSESLQTSSSDAGKTE